MSEWGIRCWDEHLGRNLNWTKVLDSRTEKTQKKSSKMGNCSVYLDPKWIVHFTLTFALPNSSIFDTVTLKNTLIFLYSLIETDFLSIICTRKYSTFSMRWKPSIVMLLNVYFLHETLPSHPQLWFGGVHILLFFIQVRPKHATEKI